VAEPVFSEVEIIRRAKKGDPAAWEVLVLSHQEPVFRFVYLLLGNPEEAEDVTQETFIRAARYLDRFEPERPLRPWLLKIGSNLARNRYRTASRYMAAIGRLIRSEPEVPPKTIEDIAAEGQEAEALWQAVRKLSHPDQEILYLRYFLDLSIDETAEAIGMAHGTIKSRCHRAIKRLRAVIESDFPLLMD
jgi:RNA polymerase sigma-70 factor (ECF subfamily)